MYEYYYYIDIIINNIYLDKFSLNLKLMNIQYSK